MRLGIVTLTQGLHDLETWLSRHLRHCGIHRFYLQLELPAVNPLVLQRGHWAELVRIIPPRRPGSLIERHYEQQLHASDGVAHGRRGGAGARGKLQAELRELMEEQPESMTITVRCHETAGADRQLGRSGLDGQQ